MKRKSTPSKSSKGKGTQKGKNTEEAHSSPSRTQPDSPPSLGPVQEDAIPLRFLVPLYPRAKPKGPEETEKSSEEPETSPEQPEKTHSSPVEVESDSSEATVEKVPVKKQRTSRVEVPLKGTEWSFKKGSRVIKATELTVQAGVWLHFLKNRLLPTTHDNSVNAIRLTMLYCILCSKPFNVGRIILEEMIKCARKKLGKLFFPSLITRLCIREDVVVWPSDVLQSEKAVIDIKTLLPRLAASKPRGASTSATAPSSVASAKPSTADQSEIAIMKAQIAEVQRQLSVFFTYSLQRDTLNNLGKPAHLTIPFPDNLFAHGASSSATPVSARSVPAPAAEQPTSSDSDE